MKERAAILAFIFLGFTTGFAQSSFNQTNRQPRSSPNMMKYKDPSKALLIAAAATTIPIFVGMQIIENDTRGRSFGGWGILAAGIIWGPSAGNLYAHDKKRGIAGIAVRGIAVTLAFLNFGGVLKEAYAVNPQGSSHEFLFTVSALVTAGAAAWNIFSAPASAREHNKRFGLSISPQYQPVSQTLGLHLAMAL